MAIPKRCVGSKVCVLQFSIFSCAHLGSSARNLSKRPKWSTYVESKVIGVKLLCLEGLVDYSIQAEDIIIYSCAFQVYNTFVCAVLGLFQLFQNPQNPQSVILPKALACPNLQTLLPLLGSACCVDPTVMSPSLFTLAHLHNAQHVLDSNLA